MTEQFANHELAERQPRRLWAAISRQLRPSVHPQTRLFWG
jgi:hypothetical protein